MTQKSMPMKKKWKWSFKKELLLCFLVLSVIPLIISNCFLIEIFRTTITQKEQKRARGQLEAMETVLLEKFDAFDCAADRLCGNRQIREGITAEDRWKQNRVYNILYEETEGLREYANFRICDEEGQSRYATGSTLYHESMPTYWGILKVARTNIDKLVMRDAVGYRTVDGLSMQAARAIYDEEDECIGYLVLDIMEEHLDKLCAGSTEEGTGFCLLDSFFDEIYSTEGAQINGMADTLRERQLSGKALNQEGDSMYYLVCEVGDTGLYLAIGKTMVFTREILTLMFFILVIMTGISLFLCLTVAKIMSDRLSEPVRTLSDAMLLAQNGNLDIWLQTKRNDEFGQLTSNFNQMTKQLKRYMQLMVRHQKELNDANIAMMHAQLNPHFLYNTLDTMKWIAKANHIEELATLASGLARIFRMSISEEKWIPLREELRMVEDYVEIQRIRFHDRFDLDIEVPLELEDCLIPKLIIQPIVENAVIHGLAECNEGHIFVNIYEKQQIMYIEVSDDGCGMDDERMELLNSRNREKMRGHLGLCNVDTILCLYYGEQYGLHVERQQTGGTKVTLKFPHEMPEGQMTENQNRADSTGGSKNGYDEGSRGG